MANGGKRPGAGRPKGSTNLPKIRDYYTPKELEEFVADLKRTAKSDPTIKKFVAEQIFGRASQSIDLTTLGESLNAPDDERRKALDALAE